MKERPILFSGPMVKAILEGIKTQTRRVVVPQPEKWIDRYAISSSPLHWIPSGIFLSDPSGVLGRGKLEVRQNVMPVKCPYGQVGDRLWVRESFTALLVPEKICGAEHCARGPVLADATRFMAWHDGTPDPRNGWVFAEKRVPSIYMPRWASRITLEITKIRVERLQEITGPDAIEEGVQYPVEPSKDFPGKGAVLWNISDKFSPLKYIADKDKGDHHQILRAHFAAFWDTLNFKRGYGWKKNPWVWVVSFKQIVQP